MADAWSKPGEEIQKRRLRSAIYGNKHPKAESMDGALWACVGRWKEFGVVKGGETRGDGNAQP